MLFTRSRRSEILSRSDFTPVKKAEVKSHADVKNTCIAKHLKLTEVKSKIAV